MPLWFQTIDDISAISSGIMTLPIMLGVVCSSIVTGLAVIYVGYCYAFIITLYVSWDRFTHHFDTGYKSCSVSMLLDSPWAGLGDGYNHPSVLFKQL